MSGLATVIVEKEYEFGTSGEALRGGKMCVFPSVINIFVGYTRPMIYIAKSLKPGSCEYNLVLRHEQTHQLINKKALDYFLPRFKAAAEKIALEIKPQKVSSSTEMASVTQKMTDEFAARMNKVVADLKQYGTVQRALIGVSGTDVNRYFDMQKAEGKEVDLGTMEGAYINEVQDGGAGAEAGLQKGDVITAIDGKKITKMAELQEYLANKRPGDKVTITYLRDKKKKTATLTLKNQQGNTNVVKHADLDVLGGNFREINDSEKKQLNISTGLVVMKINNGALKDAGISRGFIIQKVNDTPMKTIDDLQKAVKDASTSKDPVLYIQGIYPTGKKDYFAVPLQE